ncbi:MAG TPA: ATP-binding protein [Fibrobacteria bacterium]|nr:ATP-binding protein [Fibrobacteria bacterium]HOX50506.1 ATP-binding protein [Fibrobacteria bacterium]
MNILNVDPAKIRRVAMGFAVLVLAGTLGAGHFAILQMGRENARRERMIRLREMASVTWNDQFQSVRSGAMDLARQGGIHSKAFVDNGGIFQARMDQAMALVGADLGFVLDPKGKVVLRLQDSTEKDILGADLSFRRYFQKGLRGAPDLFGALGVYTRKRGIYASAPVVAQGKFLGVVVLRLRAEEIEKRMFEGIPDPVCLISPEGVVFASNRADWLFRLLPGADSRLDRVRKTRQFGDTVSFLEFDPLDPKVRYGGDSYRTLRRDLGEGWILVSLLPEEARLPLTRWQIGATIGVGLSWILLMAVAGVSVAGFLAVRRTQEERDRLTRRLDEAERLESMGRLAGGVAHDFNNVLTAIIGYSSVLEHHLANQPAEAELAKRVGQAAKRASETIRQLLAFARRSGLQAKPLSLHDLIGEIGQLLGHTFSRAIRLEFDLKAERDVVIGDANHLHQALLNLAINSRDAMPKGGLIHISTRADALRPDERIELRVSDTGSGIPAEVLPHVFEPFYTTKQGGKGTGLGLASVWGTIQRHGGAITVGSKPGEGTEFVISLPLAPRDARPDPGPSHPEVPLAVRKLRIAALDDDLHVLDAIATMVHAMGHSVEVFANFQTLRTRLSMTTPFDLVILDLDMPDVGGLEVLRWLRREKIQIPVMVASGHSGANTYDEVRRLGVREYLRKPFGAQDLQKAIEESLRPLPPAPIA